MVHTDSVWATASVEKASSALGVSVGPYLHPMASKLHLRAASDRNVTKTSIFLSPRCAQRDQFEFKTNLS